MLRSSLFALACIALAGCATHPATSSHSRLRGAELDARVRQLMQVANVPGLGVAVIENGRVVSVRAYGKRDVEKNLPLETNTTMYAASLTKAAFAYATMSLVDQGRLNLDASIATYLPKPLPDYDKYADLKGDPRWRQLTPAILLSHRSGFANFRFWQPGKDYDPNGKLQIYFDPGTRFAYSGEGINLLQFVLENGQNIDVATLMQQRLFTPFQMPRTSMTWRDDFAGNLAIGYDENGKALGHKHRESVRAAGSMDTTVSDYANLLAAMVRGDGLSDATHALWLKPVIRIHAVQQFPTMGMPDSNDNDAIGLGYALGVGTFQSPQGPVFFKEGHDDGTNNVAVCLEKQKDCVLLMSNSSNGEKIFGALIDDVLGATCYPLYWSNYIPYDHPEWRTEKPVINAHPACGVR
ncbi:CubicO group peptidase (beta-lactamase class C family) [Luteibacter sp. Sphag1AF]|uniref:serine hydrolase domain-containing protein n=1 Tax=Luteibacter sp. Sphag1AF TaxID=2587031 RepID=UPI00161BEB5D|nr:serine hydrolase domain-containing protein [Luteibacter sp. Sphag1AF]MBB3228889.1 CubicO group peptidase (beta-lactamase class C family) [Luteibacter sp. Sphag1AF]